MKLGAKEYLIGAACICCMWTWCYIIDTVETERRWKRLIDKVDAMYLMDSLMHEETLRSMSMRTQEKISKIYDNTKK